MTRRRFLATCGTAAALVSTGAAQRRKTKNLILVTADGLRWQDLFTGIDPLLMNRKDAGMTETGAPELRDRLWKPQPEERRLALLPYFWGTLAPSGVVLGNVTKGSSVQVTNRYRVSYPGYSRQRSRAESHADLSAIREGPMEPAQGEGGGVRIVGYVSLHRREPSRRDIHQRGL